MRLFALCFHPLRQVQMVRSEVKRQRDGNVPFWYSKKSPQGVSFPWEVSIWKFQPVRHLVSIWAKLGFVDHFLAQLISALHPR